MRKLALVTTALAALFAVTPMMSSANAEVVRKKVIIKHSHGHHHHHRGMHRGHTKKVVVIKRGHRHHHHN